MLPRDSNTYICIHIYVRGYAWRMMRRHRGPLWHSTCVSSATRPHIHSSTGLRMAVKCRYRRPSWLSTCISLATRPHTQTNGVTHGGEVQAPKALVAFDLCFTCYATPYISRVTHGGEVQAPRALVALDLRFICYATSYIGHRRVTQPRDPTDMHRAPQGYKAPRPNTYA